MENRGDTPVHLEAVGRAVRDVEMGGEDPEIAIRYLENIVNHPDDDKYRRIKKANRTFTSEVWLQPGVRTTFLAIGFREEHEADGRPVVVLDSVTDECRRRLQLALQRLQAIQRRKQGDGATQDAARGGDTPGRPAGQPAVGNPALPSFQGGGGRSSNGSHGQLLCQACGRSPLQEDKASNRYGKPEPCYVCAQQDAQGRRNRVRDGPRQRPDVLWRASRPNLAVTCKACGPDYFVICGQCFNSQGYQHPPEHQLVLYGAAERCAEESPWPTRNRGNKPPPPGPGRGGRPRRGPWG